MSEPFTTKAKTFPFSLAKNRSHDCPLAAVAGKPGKVICLGWHRTFWPQTISRFYQYGRSQDWVL